MVVEDVVVEDGGRRGFSPERIVGPVMEAEVLLSKGSSIEDMCQKIGVTNNTLKFNSPPGTITG